MKNGDPRPSGSLGSAVHEVFLYPEHPDTHYLPFKVEFLRNFTYGMQQMYFFRVKSACKNLLFRDKSSFERL